MNSSESVPSGFRTCRRSPGLIFLPAFLLVKVVCGFSFTTFPCRDRTIPRRCGCCQWKFRESLLRSVPCHFEAAPQQKHTGRAEVAGQAPLACGWIV